MSYNEIPNILVDSVVLPNKPLSNLEPIDAATKLSLNGFIWVFLRNTLPKQAKFNEGGIFALRRGRQRCACVHDRRRSWWDTESRRPASQHARRRRQEI